MGFNSVVFINNDAIGAIEADPAGWWRETWHALNGERVGWRQDGTYGFGSYANYFQAVSNEHADTRVVIVAGGNRARVIDKRYAFGGDAEAYDDLRIAKDLADRLGYRLVKKRAKTTGRSGSRGVQVGASA